MEISELSECILVIMKCSISCVLCLQLVQHHDDIGVVILVVDHDLHLGLGPAHHGGAGLLVHLAQFVLNLLGQVGTRVCVALTLVPGESDL